MTNRKATAPTVAHGSIAAPSLSTADEATQFLELLGKDPATTRLRAFPHKESTNKAKIAARKGEWDLEQAATWNREGRGVFVVTGNGGDKKEDITSCPALFVEWDDQPIEWQLTAWIELGLPEPTMQVPTGGRSVHNWWVMTEPISPAEFEALQIRLYTHCKSDELKDPSRVMRLPGFAYIGPDDKPAGLVELVNVTGNRYSAAEIEACLPALPAPAPAKAVAAVPSRKFTPRSIDEINAAAEYIPRRVGNEGTYESDRNALCGCSAALAEAGHSDPDGAALDLLEDKWPPGAARQALKSATTRNAASFWAIAREHGYALKRTSKTSKKSSLPALGRLPRSLLALIQQLGCGLNEKGGPSSLSAGGLAEMLPSHRFLFNELDLRAYVETTEGWQLITDADMVDAYVLLTGMGWGIGKDPVCDAILSVARQTSIHPVRDYLKKVEADTSIAAFDLDEVAKAFFRADAKLHRVMVRKWLIGAVWRAFQAGCQMDYCLVLQSEKQGLQKSTTLKALA